MESEKRFLDDKKRVERWPTKQADKQLVLAYLSTKFQLEKSYTEPEVNEVLKKWHTFYERPKLRRELVGRGFFDRDPDGSNYRLRQLATDMPDLLLVGPNLKTDPPIAVTWFDGDAGRETLRLMANTDKKNKPTTIKIEKQRVRDFVSSFVQRTWMMNYQGKSVGAVWINLEPTDYLAAPSIHIMIGDLTMRQKGIGGATLRTLIQLLKQEGDHAHLYSRYLTSNTGSAKLLQGVGFTADSDPYLDVDGLMFQNVILALK
jgi:RimJ/RimL family protein N-acetyltransferase